MVVVVVVVLSVVLGVVVEGFWSVAVVSSEQAAIAMASNRPMRTSAPFRVVATFATRTLLFWFVPTARLQRVSALSD